MTRESNRAGRCRRENDQEKTQEKRMNENRLNVSDHTTSFSTCPMSSSRLDDPIPSPSPTCSPLTIAVEWLLGTTSLILLIFDGDDWIGVDCGVGSNAMAPPPDGDALIDADEADRRR